ncbi:MAG: tRNA (adenosine(37)-N6)-threonylcarbamoyltransferase complex dimerization subunit type 1 TsaB [Acidobacteria bacterium]|nr:tRNA (adenosine(37)-N6)-threonylcarbamoyltransferase complex dimerization subunit type 1 TsaB [Acidobacteriota bacterium]
MHVLALDTTTREGSAALVDDRGVDDHLVIDEQRGDGSRAFAERMPAELLALVEARGLRVPDIDVFAVASGPGSFTGLRIGIATMQGLAFATGRPLVGVSALEALAQSAGAGLEAGALVASWMDGYRKDVFAALYEVTPGEPFDTARLREIEGPTVGAPCETLARWESLCARRPIWFVGDGARLYAEVIDAAAYPESHRLETPLLAGAIGRMAALRVRRGDATSPAAVHPVYVRRPDVEVARERSGG